MLIGVSGSYCYWVTLRLRCLGVLKAWEEVYTPVCLSQALFSFSGSVFSDFCNINKNNHRTSREAVTCLSVATFRLRYSPKRQIRFIPAPRQVRPNSTCHHAYAGFGSPSARLPRRLVSKPDSFLDGLPERGSRTYGASGRLLKRK